MEEEKIAIYRHVGMTDSSFEQIKEYYSSTNSTYEIMPIATLSRTGRDLYTEQFYNKLREALYYKKFLFVAFEDIEILTRGNPNEESFKGLIDLAEQNYDIRFYKQPFLNTELFYQYHETDYMNIGSQYSAVIIAYFEWKRRNGQNRKAGIDRVKEANNGILPKKKYKRHKKEAVYEYLKSKYIENKAIPAFANIQNAGFSICEKTYKKYCSEIISGIEVLN